MQVARTYVCVDEWLSGLGNQVVLTDDFCLVRRLRTNSRWESVVVLMMVDGGDEALTGAIDEGADWATSKPFRASEFFGEEYQG